MPRLKRSRKKTRKTKPSPRIVPVKLPKVTPISGEPFRFFVQSRSDPSVRYLVDLEEHDFNGHCGCINFEARLAPSLRAGAVPYEDRFKCYHIRCAERYQLRRLQRRIREVLNTKALEETRRRMEQANQGS